jgi:site-specific DNA-methyltransferase (cytosine-N4-specific)
MKSAGDRQPGLFDDTEVQQDKGDWRVKSFSADSACCEDARARLEEKYLPIMEVTEKFNRQSVSYQLSKADSLHGWLKYKEGFSARLVDMLIDEMDIPAGGTVLDPFLGSGTTALAAKMRGINSIGFDVMPMTQAAVSVKGRVAEYDVSELNEFAEYISSAVRPEAYSKRADYINITQGAYPRETELDIPFFSDLVRDSRFSPQVKDLGILCILNSLERLSYTAKDGQYLRWDERSEKVMDTSAARAEAGRAPLKVILNKGELPTARDLLSKELSKTIQDIQHIQKSINGFGSGATMTYRQGSSLVGLPLLAPGSIDGVITSPPYCNRYDYTRIYALELVFLGMGEEEVRQARQSLISCTVESKTKMKFLKDHYTSIGKAEHYHAVADIVNSNDAFREIMSAMSFRNSNGDINNKGIISMIRGYFEELTFIFFELHRICRQGASVAVVNDNVRYAGEVVPVDFLSTELAQQIGFCPKKIYTLLQQKGNSSQQMKKFGRTPLRKSITIWTKPPSP